LNLKLELAAGGQSCKNKIQEKKKKNLYRFEIQTKRKGSFLIAFKNYMEQRLWIHHA
jgi:hypothetical protein